MNTRITSLLIVAILFADMATASAQVSSGDTGAAQQNAAKHPTDDAGHNSAAKRPPDKQERSGR